MRIALKDYEVQKAMYEKDLLIEECPDDPWQSMCPVGWMPEMQENAGKVFETHSVVTGRTGIRYQVTVPRDNNTSAYMWVEERQVIVL